VIVLMELLLELAAYTSALHPNLECWAWSGRSSKLAIRTMSDTSSSESSSNGEGSSRGALGGEGKVIDTGKGKFGMDLQFVSHHHLASTPRG
jgi:WD repeat-containing protein 61